MRVIDIHAHYMPQVVWEGIKDGGEWNGYKLGPGPSMEERLRYSPSQRIEVMDRVGVDVQVVSVAPSLYNYQADSALLAKASRAINDEIAELSRSNPQRFSGMATLPLPDVDAAIAELERAMGLRLKGAAVETSVRGKPWDEPEFFPLFQAAERLGALLFFHPVSPIVAQRNNRYHLPNTVGNVLEDTLTVAALIFGGIVERCPGLKACVAHAGGTICYGVGRMDRGWKTRPEARVNISKPPSAYVRSLYYDCITHSEPALRLLLDTVGPDRVVLGSDWPYDMGLEEPAAWIRGMSSLSEEEKNAILGENLERLLEL